MMLFFLQDFTVVNQSGGTVRITPIGIIEAAKVDPTAKRVLPQFMTRFPALPAMKTRNFTLVPGASQHFIYDWDDIQFTEIHVTDERGQEWQLVVDAKSRQHLLSPVGESLLVIPQLTRLSPATSDVKRAVRLDSFPRKY